MKKIFLFLLIANLAAQQEKQCVVCVCDTGSKTIFSEPFCNYCDKVLAIHTFTHDILCQEQAEKLCQNWCAKTGCKYKDTKLWACKF